MLEYLKILLIVVDATCYNPVPAQTNADYNITATGKIINLDDPLSHRYIAVSRDLESVFPMGSKVLIKNTGIYDGIWYVQDRMNARWYRKIDFLVGEDDHINYWKGIIIQKI